MHFSSLPCPPPCSWYSLNILETPGNENVSIDTSVMSQPKGWSTVSSDASSLIASEAGFRTVPKICKRNIKYNF
jgi:hypothetical protein